MNTKNEGRGGKYKYIIRKKRRKKKRMSSRWDRPIELERDDGRSRSRRWDEVREKKRRRGRERKTERSGGNEMKGKENGETSGCSWRTVNGVWMYRIIVSYVISYCSILRHHWPITVCLQSPITCRVLRCHFTTPYNH